MTAISGVSGFWSNYRVSRLHSCHQQTEMEIVTTQSKNLSTICGNNAFQQSETDVKIYRFPSGEFLQLSYHKAEEFLRFLKLHERKKKMTATSLVPEAAF